MHMGEALTIDQRRARRTGFKAAVAVFLAMLVVAVILLCLFFGLRSRQDFVAYRTMADQDFHPIWRDLAWRRIHGGDDLAETIRRYPPASREDFGPYAILNYDCKHGSFNTVRIAAAKGRLIYADTDDCSLEHVFFDSPGQMQAFNEAYAQYLSQRRLETDAYQIHCAIAAGQDVFVSRRIERSAIVGDNASLDREAMRQYEELYGSNYIEMLGLEGGWTIEVSNVLAGALEPGTTLTLSDLDRDRTDLGGPDVVVLHVEDSRMIDPDSKGGELYRVVPLKALEWYQSLTPDQIKDFEALCQARVAR
jgi:hypothetical protein